MTQPPRAAGTALEDRLINSIQYGSVRLEISCAKIRHQQKNGIGAKLKFAVADIEPVI